jgi:hypothetical protein
MGIDHCGEDQPPCGAGAVSPVGRGGRANKHEYCEPQARSGQGSFSRLSRQLREFCLVQVRHLGAQVRAERLMRNPGPRVRQ